MVDDNQEKEFHGSLGKRDVFGVVLDENIKHGAQRARDRSR